MNVKNVLAFTAGFVAGAMCAGVYLKDRFSQIAQEEINSIKEEYGINSRSTEDSEEDESEDPKPKSSEQVLKDYHEVISESGYKDYNDIFKKPEKKKKVDKSGITYIDSNEYGQDSMYDTIELVYYADGVLADDQDERVEDPISTLGVDFVDHLGEFTPEMLFVKNDKFKAYYEVSVDSRSFDDIVGN